MIYEFVRTFVYEINRTINMKIQKASNRDFKPTESELEILKILWKNKQASVRLVHDELAKNRDIGYTTTLKLMQIMLEKGMVSRDESQRSHIYQAIVDQSETRQEMLEKLLDGMFAGSASRMVMQVLGSHGTTKEELEDIRAYLNNFEE